MSKKEAEIQGANRLTGKLNKMQGSKIHPEATPEEAKQRRETMQTRGKKGAKLTRINAAFTDSNIEYVKIMSKVRGESMSEFINHVMDKDRAENAEIFEQAKEIKAQT